MSRIESLLRQAAELHVSPGREGETAVAQPLCRVTQSSGLKYRQVTGGHPHSGQVAVRRGVQPQRSWAGVTAVPYGRFGPRGARRGGGRHGREHTHDGAPRIRGGGTCMTRSPAKFAWPGFFKEDGLRGQARQ